MAGKPAEIKFLVYTQRDHSTTPARYAQMAEARSYLTSRQHANRRSKDAFLKASDTTSTTSRAMGSTAGSTSSTRRRSSRTKSTEVQDVSADGTSTCSQQSQNVVSEIPFAEPNQDFSLQDLAAVFEDNVSIGHHNDASSVLSSLLSPGGLPNTGSSPSYEQDFNISGDDQYLDDLGSPTMTAALNLPSRARPLSQSSPAQSRTIKHNSSDHRGGPQSSIAFTLPLYAEVHSTLDPFVRLPFEISKQEKSLIHFYLNFGRRWLLGTSVNPKCCPAIEIARSRMQVCPTYTLAHVVIGELILSGATQRPLRPNYYSRCAQMYSCVNALLSDPDATFHQKLWALIQLAMVEHTAQRPELQALHIEVIDELIDSNGGAGAFLTKTKDDDPIEVNARLFAAQFIRAQIRLPTFQRMQMILPRFLETLQRVQDWVLALHDDEPTTHIETSTRTSATNRASLNRIINYIYRLIEKWLSDTQSENSFYENSGAYFCTFSLAMTMVEYSLSATDTFAFLQRTQDFMAKSTTVSSHFGHELDRIHPVAAANNFSQARAEMFPGADSNEREARISQAMADGHKMLVLLSKARRIEIVMWLSECVWAVTRTREELKQRKEVKMCDAPMREQLKVELEHAWWVAQSAKKPKRRRSY